MGGEKRKTSMPENLKGSIGEKSNRDKHGALNGYQPGEKPESTKTDWDLGTIEVHTLKPQDEMSP